MATLEIKITEPGAYKKNGDGEEVRYKSGEVVTIDTKGYAAEKLDARGLPKHLVGKCDILKGNLLVAKKEAEAKKAAEENKKTTEANK